jgi:predicted DsbA family dithiol-disulfide isomerase
MEIIVFHDTVCPWCRIGKRHLERALVDWPHPVSLRFWPFFLDPGVPAWPAERPAFREHFARRKGLDGPMVERVWQHAASAGRAVGLDFRFDRIERATNTLRSHRLIALTPEGDRPAVVEAIYRAYFDEGRDIDDVEVLADLAASIGLDRGTLADPLRGDAGETAVLDAARQALVWGVTGVPLFIFDQRLAVSGAQPAEAMLDALRRASAAEVHA